MSEDEDQVRMTVGVFNKKDWEGASLVKQAMNKLESRRV
jgi:hypothetical protein